MSASVWNCCSRGGGRETELTPLSNKAVGGGELET
jgi:hypothetical protein